MYVCPSRISSTVHPIASTLGGRITGEQRKCSVEFHAIWTHCTNNVNKLKQAIRELNTCIFCWLCFVVTWGFLNWAQRWSTKFNRSMFTCQIRFMVSLEYLNTWSLVVDRFKCKTFAAFLCFLFKSGYKSTYFAVTTYQMSAF